MVTAAFDVEQQSESRHSRYSRYHPHLQSTSQSTKTYKQPKRFEQWPIEATINLLSHKTKKYKNRVKSLLDNQSMAAGAATKSS